MAGRSVREILLTGAVNSDESRKVQEAGYSYGKPCKWCRSTGYTTKGGLCLPCDAAMRSEDDPS
jgi:hypothetical protein